MDSSTTSAATEEAVQSPSLEIPVLGDIVREEKIDLNQSTIVRDFAYDAENPLFWSSESASEAQAADESGMFAHQSPIATYDTSEGSGFKGAPPWLQSSIHDGLSEEDTTSLTPDDELHGKAEALFDFTPEHENEFALQEGQVIYISSRHGLGWLVAVDMETGDCGLVPEEYVRLLDDDEQDGTDAAGVREMDTHPEMTSRYPTTAHETQTEEPAGEWVDEPDTNSAAPRKPPDAERASIPQGPQELTDDERQRIMDAAEREMALMDARFRDI